MTVRDQWAEWLLKRRFAGEDRRPILEFLGGIRETVLDNAGSVDGETVLDVGCGDGLIGFGALDRGAAHVVFTDISQELLNTCQATASDLGVADRCSFVPASADELTGIDDESVDLVTTRSVLVYVTDKQRAFGEFYRVLRDGARLSIFEPISRYGLPWPPSWLWGYDLPGLEPLVARVRAVFERIQPLDSDPMLDFDERDLVDIADQAGFATVRLQLGVEIKPLEPRAWDAWLRTVPNPKLPSLDEAIDQALQPTERDELLTRLRPLVEQGQGRIRTAAAYLQATKA